MDSAKHCEHVLGAPVGNASSAFLEAPAELLTTSQVQGRRKRKSKLKLKMQQLKRIIVHREA